MRCPRASCAWRSATRRRCSTATARPNTGSTLWIWTHIYPAPPLRAPAPGKGVRAAAPPASPRVHLDLCPRQRGPLPGRRRPVGGQQRHAHGHLHRHGDAVRAESGRARRCPLILLPLWRALTRRYPGVLWPLRLRGHSRRVPPRAGRAHAVKCTSAVRRALRAPRAAAALAVCRLLRASAAGDSAVGLCAPRPAPRGAKLSTQFLFPRQRPLSNARRTPDSRVCAREDAEGGGAAGSAGDGDGDAGAVLHSYARTSVHWQE